MQVNTDSTLGTAILRSVYAAVLLGLIAFVTTYQQTDDLKASALAGAATGLGTLAVRGAGEGLIDQHRQAVNDQRPSDVGFNRLAIRRDETDWRKAA